MTHYVAMVREKARDFVNSTGRRPTVVYFASDERVIAEREMSQELASLTPGLSIHPAMIAAYDAGFGPMVLRDDETLAPGECRIANDVVSIEIIRSTKA